MAYICTKAGSCPNCGHYRYDEDKQEKTCWAQVDALTHGPDYELAFYKQFNLLTGSEGLGLAIRGKNGYTDDWGLPEYSVLTVNLPGPVTGQPEMLGFPNAAYMDVNKSAKLIEELKKLEINGRPVATDTGSYLQSGFVKYPLFRFDEEWLRSLPVMYGAFGDYDKYREQF